MRVSAQDEKLSGFLRSALGGLAQSLYQSKRPCGPDVTGYA